MSLTEKMPPVSYDRNAELDNCTFIKTVMMFFIVAYHSAMFWANDGFFAGKPAVNSGVLSSLSDIIIGLSCHIYVFMFVSGYLFAFLKLEKNRYDSFRPFAVNKARRLMIPYVFVSLAWAIPATFIFFDFPVSRVVRRFALAESPNQLWYLIVTFEIFIVFYLLFRFFADKDLAGLAVVFVLYFAGALGFHYLRNIFAVWQTLQMAAFFWLGFKIRQRGSSFIRRIPLPVWIAAHLILLAAVMLVKDRQGIIFLAAEKGLTFLLYFIGTISNFLFWQKVASKAGWHRGSFIFLSGCTMGIYLFHQQIIYVCLYFLNGKINPYINILINFAVSFAVAFVITAVFRKFRITRQLIGEKP